jgi:Mg/Co/Ni transporter MgtE
VRISRVFAYLMIAFGALLLFTGSVLNGVWIAFVGWFLLSAGSSEEVGTTVRGLLSSVPVSAAMTAPVVTIPDWLTVEQFLESIAPQHTFTTYPVHDPSGKLTGIVRLGDLVRMPPGARAETRLRDRARPIAEVATARPDEDLAALIQRVGASLDQRVLVFDGDRLVGIVSPVDVARVVAIRQTNGGGGTPAPAATRGST